MKRSLFKSSCLRAVFLVVAIVGGSVIVSAQSITESRFHNGQPVIKKFATATIKAPTTLATPTPIVFNPFKCEIPPRHPVNPNTKITLPNGKVVTAQEYIDSLNQIEKGLNQYGHSMREPSGAAIGVRFADAAQFQRQVSAYRESIGGKITGSAIAPASTPTESQTSVGTNRIIGRERKPGGSLAASALGSTGARQLPTSTLRESNTLSTQVATPRSQYSRAAEAKRQSLVDKEVAAVAAISKSNQAFDKSFTGGFGDSNFGATITAGISVKGSSNPGPTGAFASANSQITATAGMEADANIMGNSFKLLQFNAQCSGSSNLNTSYNVGMYVGGVQIFQDRDSTTGPVLHWQDGFSIDWDAQSPTFVLPIFGPFQMQGFVGVKGNAGVTGSFEVRPTMVSGGFAPFITASAYGEITAGVDLGVASANFGVHADLVLIDDHLNFNLDAGVTWDPQNKFMAVQNCFLENKLTAMSGTFSLVAHVYGPWGFKLYDWSQELAGWPGETSDAVYSAPTKTKLNWH